MRDQRVGWGGDKGPKLDRPIPFVTMPSRVSIDKVYNYNSHTLSTAVDWKYRKRQPGTQTHTNKTKQSK